MDPSPTMWVFFTRKIKLQKYSYKEGILEDRSNVFIVCRKLSKNVKRAFGEGYHEKEKETNGIISGFNDGN